MRLTPEQYQLMVENLRNGIMDVPFEILTEGNYLFDNHVGFKVFKSHTDLITWIGSTLDLALWHRCAQIDFNRSTVVGVAAAYSEKAGHHIQVDSISFNGVKLLVTMNVTETIPSDTVRYCPSKPFQIIKFLSCDGCNLEIIKKEIY